MQEGIYWQDGTGVFMPGAYIVCHKREITKTFCGTIRFAATL